MNQYIDHTLLLPDSNKKDLKNLCREAANFNFASVCVHPHNVVKAKEYLKNTKVKICTVIGFPLGQNTTDTKIFEAKNAVENGADEIDMVINVSWLKNKNYGKIENEISEIKKEVVNKILKVIIEISLLSDQEIIKMSKIVSSAGADFIKTSTGFGAHGATFEAIKLMKANVSPNVQIKASGGIRDFATAKTYINLGATRLGTSSGIEIMKGKTSTKSY